MNRIPLILTLGLVLAGCASQNEKLAKDIRDRERVMRDLEEERRDWAQKDARRELRRTPDWALNPAPQPDSTGLYAIGIADSDNPQIALRKANMQGLYDLGRAMNQAIAGMERQRIVDNGSSSHDSYSLTAESLVDWADVTGWEVVKQELVPIDGRHHAYVLLKLPFASANQVLQERRRNATLENEKAAFDELQRRLEAYRAAQAERAPAVAAQPAAPAVEVLPLDP